MTSIIHDMRPPTVVIVGQFNPAIFSPFWTATELYGIGEGQEVKVTETTMELPNGVQMMLTYLEGIGINFATDKVNLSLVNFEEQTVDRTLSVLRNMFEKLPHTPVGAIGVNFRFFDSNPSQEVLDLFDTPEGLEANYEISERTQKFKMTDADSILNFSRNLSDGEVLYQFNFHRQVANTKQALDLLVADFLKSDFAKSKNLLQDIYGYNEFSSISFEDGAQVLEGIEDGEKGEG